MESTSPFASALFDLSIEEDRLENYYHELTEIKEILKKNDTFLSLLDCQFLTVSERKEIVDKTFASYQTNIRNFLKILIVRHKICFLENIIDEFFEKYYQKIGIQKGKIYSVEKLSEKEIEKIQMTFLEKKKKKVLLENEVDPTLIGGIRVVLGDRIYDGSLKNKLENMKLSLKKEGDNKK